MFLELRLTSMSFYNSFIIMLLLPMSFCGSKAMPGWTRLLVTNCYRPVTCKLLSLASAFDLVWLLVNRRLAIWSRSWEDEWCDGMNLLLRSVSCVAVIKFVPMEVSLNLLVKALCILLLFPLLLGWPIGTRRSAKLPNFEIVMSDSEYSAISGL